MGTNCAPLVVDLFLLCYEREVMMYLSDYKKADISDAFNTTSRYLDEILDIYNVYFYNMVSQIYPPEHQLIKLIPLIPKPRFRLAVKIMILNCQFPILDGDVPHSTSYGVYISQLIRFARASSHVADFNTHNVLLT